MSLESIPPFEEESEVLTMSEAAVSSALKKLNFLKASGPDGMPNWLLREYVELIAGPVTSVIDSSFAEQRGS